MAVTLLRSRFEDRDRVRGSRYMAPLNAEDSYR